METFGERVKANRDYRDWSQEELGRRVSELIGRNPPYTKAAVQKWESGDTGMPPGDAVWALSQIFAIPYELLLWGPDKKPQVEHKRTAPPIRKPSFPND